MYRDFTDLGNSLFYSATTLTVKQAIIQGEKMTHFFKLTDIINKYILLIQLPEKKTLNRTPSKLFIQHPLKFLQFCRFGMTWLLGDIIVSFSKKLSTMVSDGQLYLKWKHFFIFLNYLVDHNTEFFSLQPNLLKLHSFPDTVYTWGTRVVFLLPPA